MTILSSSKPLTLPLSRLMRFLLGGLWIAFQLACNSEPSSPAPSKNPALAAESAAGPVPARATGDRPLSLGIPIVRELKGGERHVYGLALKQGWYAAVRVGQPGIDVALSLSGPDGKHLLTVDDPEGRLREERVSLVAPVGGEYQLTVTSTSRKPQAPGLYRIELRELHRAGPADTKRVAAELAFAAARALQSSGKGESSWQQALTGFRESLRLWTAAGDLDGEARALLELGSTSFFLEDYKTAIRWCAQAIDLAQKTGDRQVLAEAFNCEGNSYYRSKDPKKALELDQKALTLWQPLRNGEGEGRARYSIGSLYIEQGEYATAEAELQKARQLMRGAGDAGGEAMILIPTQDVYYRRGEIARALDSLNNALKLSRSVGDQATEAAALYNLGRIQKMHGELEEARRSFEEVVRVNHGLGEIHGEIYAQNALGSVLFDLGDWEGARAQFEGVAKKSSQPTDQARALNNIGRILYVQKHWPEALASFERAFEITRKLGDTDDTYTKAAVLNNRGVVLTALGRPAEGFKDLQEALAIRITSGSLYERAQTLIEIGTAGHQLRAEARAAQAFAQARNISRRIEAPGLEAECLFRWAELDRDQGQLNGALDKIKQSIKIVESVRNRAGGDKLRTSFFASKRAYYAFYVDLLMRLRERYHDASRQAEALAVSERARARGLLDLLAEGRIDLRQGLPPELRQKETDLSVGLVEVLNKLEKSSEDVQASPLQERLTAIEGQIDKLDAQINRANPRYARLRHPAFLGPAGIRDLLDEKTAFLEYFAGEKASFLFVVTRSGLASYRLPPAAEISDFVQKFRSLIEGRVGRADQFGEQAFRLYQLLLAPAAKQLVGKKSLLIAPDGPLYFLPFEALLTARNTSRGGVFAKMPYLLRSYSVSYVPSASVLQELRKAEPVPGVSPGAGKTLVAFADPIYANALPAKHPAMTGQVTLRGASAAASSFDPLPFSKKEAEAIASLYPREAVQLYIGKEATEENVKNNPLLETAAEIHFAMHASVEESQPEQSALVLSSPGPGSTEDGRLRVSEIFNLKLRANLVVLSACKTAQGKQVSGEGIVGLTRAFLYAGARSMVVSLWPVVDRTAPGLMRDFYASLGSSSKAEALRQAKLKMIDAGQAHPFYWAPFVLSGDPK